MYIAEKIIAIETPVTDYLYNEAKSDETLRDNFLRYLKPDRPPRKGENILVSAETWQEKLLTFARDNKLLINTRAPLEQQAIQVRNRIFGEPRGIEAGGALANSFDSLVKSQINGAPLLDGFFITALGEGVSGDVFARSLPGKLKMPVAQGRQMEAHIIPVDGDRIIIALPSFINPPSNHMSPTQLDDVEIDSKTMVMLGGYMKYTGKYDQFLKVLLSKVVAVSENPQDRPTIVLTAAAQDVAASQSLQDALARCSQVAPTVISANTGEFRRLMDMDTEWRKPHETKWWVHETGQSLANCAALFFIEPYKEQDMKFLQNSGWRKLEGEDLEKAKQADNTYMADKLAANQAAYKAAHEKFCEGKPLPVTFVVTNGKKGVHVVSGLGISDTYLPPKPPHGVVNTVGGGDGFAAGYLLGHAKRLSEDKCVELGFICAGEIIGRDEARLKPKTISTLLDEKPTTLEGLPSYLNPANSLHGIIFTQLKFATEPLSSEIEKKFLVVGDGWRRAAQEVAFIQQNYFPSLEEKSIQLRITKTIGGVYVNAFHPEKGDVASCGVLEKIIERFGVENLRLLTDENGIVPVGDNVEARIRVKNDNAVMTIKAKTDIADKRCELEFPISAGNAENMLPYCSDTLLKTRHKVLNNGNTWEVDTYHGPNDGLVTGEIELPHTDSKFVRPMEWLGADVTEDARYSNRSLARTPYSVWGNPGP